MPHLLGIEAFKSSLLVLVVQPIYQASYFEQFFIHVDMFCIILTLLLFWIQILGMVASLTPLPVIGVPVRASTLDGVDSLLSIVQVMLHK